MEISQKEKEQLRQLFLSTQDPNNETRKQNRRILVEVSDKPEFPAYACEIMADVDQPLEIRYIAAVCLKSVLSRGFSPLSQPCIDILEKNIPKIFVEEPNLMKKAAKFTIVALIIRQKILKSEKMLAFLIEAIQKGTEINIADALECFGSVFEDLNHNMENFAEIDTILSSNFVNNLIDTLFQLIPDTNPEKVRIQSFGCLSNLVVSLPPKLMSEMENMVLSLLKIISDPSHKIRKLIYTLLMASCSQDRPLFINKADQIFPILTQALEDPDLSARRSVCSIFWEFCNSFDPVEEYEHIRVILPYMPNILKQLLNNLMLTQKDIDNIEDPHHFQNKKFDLNELEQLEATDKDIEEFFDEDQSEFNLYSDYTLRKVSMETIKNIINHLEESTFILVKDSIDLFFQSKDITKMEAAVCYIGIVAKNADYAFRNIVDILIPRLLECSMHENEFLSTSAIWSLSRLLGLITSSNNKQQSQKWVGNYLEILFKGLNSKNSRIQDACSLGFKKVIEYPSIDIQSMGERIIPDFISMISSDLPSAFIVDSLQQFIEKFTDKNQARVLLDQFSGPLIHKMETTSFSEYPELLNSLVQCFSALVKTAQQHSTHLLERPLTLTINTALKVSSYLHNQKNRKSKSIHRKLMDYNHYMVTLLLGCMDCLITIIEVLESKIQQHPLNFKIAELISFCADLDQNEIKIYTFSLLGDISLHDPFILAQNSSSYIEFALNHCNILPHRIDPGMYTQQICKIISIKFLTKLLIIEGINALYMLSNFLINFKSEIECVISHICIKLNKIFEIPKLSQQLTINIAFLIGKIGHSFPEKVGLEIHFIIKRAGIGFCYAKSSIPELPEAYLGFIKIIQRNPNLLLQDLSFFLESVGRYSDMPDNVKEQVKPIIQELIQTNKFELKQAYKKALDLMSSAAKEKLIQMFQVIQNQQYFKVLQKFQSSTRSFQ